jgi:hypothetical protein
VPRGVGGWLTQDGGADLEQRGEVGERDVPVDAVLRQLRLGDRDEVHGQDRHAGYAFQGGPAAVGGDGDAVDVRPPPGLRVRVGAVHHQAVQAFGREVRAAERAELAAFRVGHHRPAFPRLDDGRAEGFQVGQVAVVDVQVHPVLGRPGLGDPVDPDRVLRRRAGQQPVTALLHLPGPAEDGRPERAEALRVARVQAQVLELRDRHGKEGTEGLGRDTTVRSA